MIGIMQIRLKLERVRAKLRSLCIICYFSLISRTDKVELIATEFFQQSCDCLGYLEQHTKSCKSYLVGKYIYFRLKNDKFYAKSGH